MVGEEYHHQDLAGPKLGKADEHNIICVFTDRDSKVWEES